MVNKRVLVGYGIDVDAVSNHINTTHGGKPNLMNISRGVFGATRGVERLLKLYERKGIKASWYIPGHSIETFPEEMAKIRDTGHEIGLHGYTHEFPSDLSREQLETILVKTIDILTNFCHGEKPKGFTAPAWKNSPDQIELLEKLGIGYDHSFMHDDFQAYYASTGRDEVVLTDYAKEPTEWMVPMKHAQKTGVVEIPASWTLDDWPPLQYMPDRPNSVSLS
ncbi:hypothetical protein A1O1_03404 [Capronia coronata CBS 617.96]|uniref:NodB homology domain-containing protein n=1 Tax=Capronia coronata CBS 617.96 TaxID=1182541 RepID=W9YKU1_9EURO|nr:uncharacterized protein A1O1_03404 [Capronia coronata CBS 617.96]EXJ90305.1 hypothetical protein A1O1_03404 [Capronia coronata CBS 617.96]